MRRPLLLLLLITACDEPPTQPGEDPDPGEWRGSFVAGDGVTATVTDTIDAELLLIAADERPVAGATVAWRGLHPNQTATPLGTSVTDTDGRATIRWGLGQLAGTWRLAAAAVVAGDTFPLDTATATARPGPATIATVTTPALVTLAPGDTLRMGAIVSDAFGNVVPTAGLGWTSSEPAVAALEAELIRAVSGGIATITAPVADTTLRVYVTVRDPALEHEILLLAIGSCSDEDLPQPVWRAVLDARPDVWAWLGDNVYGDTEDMTLLASKYAKQKSHPDYQSMLASMVVVGTWDDHDYGRNNAGSEYPKRAESQQVFLDFFDVPAEDPRRSIEGVYSDTTFGAPGRRVKILFLDTRYHREFPCETCDVLGEAQWTWLEEELRTSDAQVNIIASGIQIVAEDHIYEKWSRFPQARQRLFDLVGETGARGVILLSGDRHYSEISRLTPAGAVYPLHDLTSSGLTHPYEFGPQEYNRHRAGAAFGQRGYGLIRFDWTGDPSVSLEIRDVDGRVRSAVVIPLTDLQ